jgi:hypothetical protein
MKKLIFAAAFAFLSLSTVDKSAHAANNATGFVCNVDLTPGASGDGNYGFVVASLYSGPSCTGSYYGYYYFCSTGATPSSQCSPWPYSEIGLNTLFQGLREAAAANQKIFAQTYNGAAWIVNFYAAGY